MRSINGIKRAIRFMLMGLASTAVALSGLRSTASAFDGLGTGTVGDPYRITNCEQLQSINDDLDANYILTNDIDCSATTTWNSGQGFIPIGLSFPYFTGTFNGQDFTINSLYINRTDNEMVGLFSFINSATVANVHMRAGSITTTGTSVYNGTIVAYASGSTISNCSSTTTLTSTGGGGIVGFITNGTLSKCWYGGSLTTTDNRYAGGVFALSTDTTVSDLYSTGELTARGGIAGVVGNNTDINNVYSDADVTFDGDTFDAGGLFGSIDGVFDPTTASNVFFAGSITAPSAASVGGAIGGLEGGATVTGVYYDAFLCSCSVGIGETDGGSGTATAVNIANATPSYFKGNNTNAPLDGWNFTDIWQTNTGAYPTLQNQPRTDSSTEDLNGDGIYDSAQPNISGYILSKTGKIIVIDVGEDCEITTDDTESESDLPVSDPAYEYESDLFDFAADCPSAGYTTTIRLYYYGFTKDGRVLRKYNPNTNAYFNLTGAYGATLEQTTIGGNIVTVATYQITDGGVLDMDGVADAAIEDPVGLATLVLGAPNTGLRR